MTCEWVSSEDENIKCNHKADESGYCIFHKKNKSKKETEKFSQMISNDEISDFRGYVFEENFTIRDIVTYDYDKLSFSEAIFMKKADFSDFEFKEDVSFNYVDFRNKVSFKSSSFLGDANFYRVKFNETFISDKIFEKVKFKGQNLIINGTENLPRMDGLIFSGCSKFILRNISYEKRDYLYGKINYRIARNQANKIGDHERIGHYYYKERTYGSKTIKYIDYESKNEYLSAKFFDLLSKYTIGYGERPWNILIVTCLIISIFAFLYMFVGIKTIDYRFIGVDINEISNYSIKEIINIYVDLWYFSMVTFSTVGYGDMIVTSILGKILVSVEVFLGVTIGATWASVVIKRMIR